MTYVYIDMSSKSPKGNKTQSFREFVTPGLFFNQYNYNSETHPKMSDFHIRPLSPSKKKENEKKAKKAVEKLKLSPSKFTMGAGRRRKSNKHKTRKYRTNRK